MSESSEASKEQPDSVAILELIGFLAPNTRLDVRRTALQYVVSLSGALDGSASRLFMANDCAMGAAVCTLCESTEADRSQTLSALTNFSSGSPEVANFILTRSRCTQLAFDACRSHTMFANFAARLLANLSRHFPDRVNELLEQHEPKALDIIVDLFSTSSEDTTSSIVGYTLVNMSTLSAVRHRLVASSLLNKICPLTLVEDKKEMAADVLRNLAFEDALHPILLNESDDYLVALVAPLADCSDDLSDEEIEKLPLRLQYYEGTREPSISTRQKLIEALYQLCSTRHSREYLRKKGVYAILRELDRATEDVNEKPSQQTGWIGGVKLLAAQQDHTLHALIGILIRLEDEMAVHPDIESLRSLE
nr:Uncharacterised protein family UPF0507 domain containing protein [Haemonchus contortus]